jgi:hypothetical protein
MKYLTKPITPTGTEIDVSGEIPQVAGRLCKHKGMDSVEVSCPYCGRLHYHSCKPIPGIRTAHCGLPQICRSGSYLVKNTYNSQVPQMNRPKDWLNFYGETVKVLNIRANV